MAHSQGRLHALRRSRLPQGLSGARRDRAICQRHRRFRRRELHRLRLLREGCPFNIPRISKVEGKAHKCTLCSDRVAVGQGPACAKACPTQAIVFGTKDEMPARQGRITDLKSRGFTNAGLYNPDGVGGTHVMYVLHHADKPELYAGLAANPVISPLVEVWKGVGKVTGLAAIGGWRPSPCSIRSLPDPIASRGMTSAMRRGLKEAAIPLMSTPATRMRRADHRQSVQYEHPHQPLGHGGLPHPPRLLRASRFSTRASSS